MCCQPVCACVQVQEKIRKWIINFYADPPEGEEKEKTEPKVGLDAVTMVTSLYSKTSHSCQLGI